MIRKFCLIFILLSITILPACDTNSYKYTIPLDLADGWQVDSLASVNINESLLSEMVDEVQSGRYGFVHSILIIKDDHLVFEKYFNSYTWEMFQDIRSCTKSVTSTLIGIALDKGYISSVDVRLFSFFPEYNNLNNSQKDKITLSHVLSMTSGLDWDEWQYPYNDPRNPWNQMTNTDDWLEFVLSMSCIYEPGERWFYNSGGSMLLSGIIRNSTGLQAKEFGLQNLFRPLGISEYIWNSNSAGLTMTYSNLFIRPRDMAKIGYIYINNGEWNGAKILSEEWITEATRDRIMTTSGDAAYAYQWWKRRYNVNNATVESFSAEGSGENYIFCFDSLKMIVVITAANWDVWFNVLDIVPRFILPSTN